MDTNKIKDLIKRLLAIDNLYIKFILSIIAIALCIIAYKIQIPDSIDVDIPGYVDVRGNLGVEVSGGISTYEENTVEISGKIFTW